jgi:hypothetical protein
MRNAFLGRNPVWMWFDFAVHIGQLRRSNVCLRLRCMRFGFVVILCVVGSCCGHPLPQAGHRLISEDGPGLPVRKSHEDDNHEDFTQGPYA